MQTPSLYQQIADRLQIQLNDDLIFCIEAACVTEMEWQAEPEEVLSRVRGAQEETEDFS